jgi:hypothetical protein
LQICNLHEVEAARFLDFRQGVQFCAVQKVCSRLPLVKVHVQPVLLIVTAKRLDLDKYYSKMLDAARV